MNLITSDMACSLYPRATFQEWCTLSFPRDDGTHIIGVAKYVCHGWRAISEVCPPDCNMMEQFRPGTLRTMADSHCWRIPLNMEGVYRQSPLNIVSTAISHDPTN